MQSIKKVPVCVCWVVFHRWNSEELFPNSVWFYSSPHLQSVSPFKNWRNVTGKTGCWLFAINSNLTIFLLQHKLIMKTVRGEIVSHVLLFEHHIICPITLSLMIKHIYKRYVCGLRESPIESSIKRVIMRFRLFRIGVPMVWLIASITVISFYFYYIYTSSQINDFIRQIKFRSPIVMEQWVEIFTWHSINFSFTVTK